MVNLRKRTQPGKQPPTAGIAAAPNDRQSTPEVDAAHMVAQVIYNAVQSASEFLLVKFNWS